MKCPVCGANAGKYDPEEADSHWKDKHKALKREAQFMLSLLNVEQRRRLRRWKEARQAEGEE